MAKVSSARPPSRQSQDGTAAARTTRTTRSQSREPSEPRATKRSNTRGAQQSSATLPKKAAGRKAKSTVDLDTVDEDAAAEDEEQEEIQVLDEEPPNISAHVRRISTYSGISGTTAKTSFSQEEIGERDPEVMMDVLPRLAAAADELSKMLVPADPKSRAVVRKEIRTQGSRQNKLYNARLGPFNVNKAFFGSREYIQPSIVVRAFLGVKSLDDVPDASWRPDNVICKINLASMLRTVLVVLADNIDVTEDGFNSMANLEGDVPNAIAGPSFEQSAFELCLALLTQYSIMRVRAYMADPSIDARDVIQDTFYSMDKDGDQSFRYRDGLHMTQLRLTEETAYRNAVNAVNERVTDLTRAFDEADAMAALGALRARYPWQAFVDHVIDYYLERKVALETQIQSVGGVDQVMLDLTAEVDRRVIAREADMKRLSFSRPGGTPKKAFGKEAIRQLKAMEARHVASTAPLPGPVPVAQMTSVSTAQSEPRAATQQDDGYTRLEDDDDYPVPPKQVDSSARSMLQGSARAALEGVQATQRQNAAKAKGRFIDPQPNAAKIRFDDTPDPTQHDQTPSASARSPAQQIPRHTPAKRAFVEEDDEDEDEGDFQPTQDQGFEVDTRDASAADQRRRAAPQQQAASPRFSSANASSSAPQASTAARQMSSSPAKRQRKNPGSSIPAPLAPLDPEDDIELPKDERLKRAKVSARHQTAMAREGKPTRSRVQWDETEENALIALIEEECDDGISYAQLKALDSARGEGKLLGRRNAEDLRFKARNLKATFLLGRTGLPRNFDHIVLDQKAIRKLHSHGIVYRQERLRGAVVEIDSQ